MTIVIQIGNSDNKLTQLEWSNFVNDINEIVEKYGDVHFFGGSNFDKPWQNACWVLNLYDDKHSFDLREELLEPKSMYMQDSIAFTVGDTDFV